MVAEHSNLRVTAEPFVPQQKVPASAPTTPLKKSDSAGATPSKTYRLRELSAEEIAAKSIRPSPVRAKKQSSPSASIDSPMLPNPYNLNQLRVGKNSCTKLHCKRCAYREMAKGETRRELEFVKDHDEDCINRNNDTPVLPRAMSRTSGASAQKENDNRPFSHSPNTSTSTSTSTTHSFATRSSRTTTPTAPANSSSPSSSSSSSSTHTRSVSPAVSDTVSPSATTILAPSSSSSSSSVASASSSPSHTQQLMRAALLLVVAILLLLLLAQRSGVWKSTLRAVAAAIVALGTVVIAPTAIAAHR